MKCKATASDWKTAGKSAAEFIKETVVKDFKCVNGLDVIINVLDYYRIETTESGANVSHQGFVVSIFVRCMGVAFPIVLVIHQRPFLCLRRIQAIPC